MVYPYSVGVSAASPVLDRIGSGLQCSGDAPRLVVQDAPAVEQPEKLVGKFLHFFVEIRVLGKGYVLPTMGSTSNIMDSISVDPSSG